MVFSNPVSWPCESCGNRRPEQMISTIESQAVLESGPVVKAVKYCNDRTKCLAGAKEILDEWYSSTQDR